MDQYDDGDDGAVGSSNVRVVILPHQIHYHWNDDHSPLSCNCSRHCSFVAAAAAAS